MNNNLRQLSKQELDDKISELIAKGYDYNSAEIQEIFKEKALRKYQEQRNIREKSLYNDKATSATSTETFDFYKKPIRVRQKPNHSQSENSSQENPSKSYADYNDSSAHIVIDTLTGEYNLLDSNYKITATTHSNPIINFFTKRRNLKKFKRQLNSDFKDYKSKCRFNYIKYDPDFKKMHRAMKFYLWICPDADYNILELLRKNITKIDPQYQDYQTACYEYLRELANFNNSDPNNLGFDITLATPTGISLSNHRYFCNVIKRSDSTVSDYIKRHKPHNSASGAQYVYENSTNYSSPTYSHSRARTNPVQSTEHDSR